MKTVCKIFTVILLAGLGSCASKDPLEKTRAVEQLEEETIPHKSRDLDSTLASENVNTDTTFLSNGALLFYQIDHDSLWLTLENKEKKVLFSTGFDLVGYHYRLDYFFCKEYDKYLLFRYGCPANGPCNFVLINKKNGDEFLQLPELIYDHNKEFDDNYLIYFSPDRRNFIFYNINTNKEFEFEHGVDDFLTAITPAYEIDSIRKFPKRYDFYYDEIINGKRTAKKVTVDLK